MVRINEYTKSRNSSGKFAWGTWRRRRAGSPSRRGKGGRRRGRLLAVPARRLQIYLCRIELPPSDDGFPDAGERDGEARGQLGKGLAMGHGGCGEEEEEQGGVCGVGSRRRAAASLSSVEVEVEGEVCF